MDRPRKCFLKKMLAVLGCILFFCTLPATTALAGGNSDADGTPENPYHILYLSSYSYSWATVPLQIQGVERAFAGAQYVVNYEFMDTKNTGYSEGYKEFYDLLKYKMETRYPYDGVVVGDDAALNFVEQYQDELFADIPIAFLAVDDVENGEKAAQSARVTGVVERADYAKNLEVARKLLPEATDITFILDNKENGVGIAKQLKKQTELFQDYGLHYLNTSEYTREDLCKKLASFTKNDIVFFVSMGQQKDGIILTENERYQMIRQYGSVPMFRLTPAGVGDGAVGGYVVDFEESGYLAGEMIEQMLQHPDLAAPDICYDTPGMYYFDYAVMKKFGLNIAHLPQEAIVINEPESIWKTYSNQIIIGMLVLLLVAFAAFSIVINRAQNKVKAQNHALVVANHAKTDFLSHMSHDIRTPLNGIIGMTDVALHDNKDERVGDSLELIASSSRFLLSLINDILDISKIENGSLFLQEKPVSLKEFDEVIHSVIQPLMDNKDIEFIYQMNCGMQCACIDPVRFKQVFLNLLSNASKYTPAGGRVEFLAEHLSEDDKIEWVRFVVQDNGIGMEPEFCAHAFEAFEQEENDNAHLQNHGTGLGLAICKELVELMGGRITLQSERNKGTKFTVELPLKKAELPQEEKSVAQLPNMDERLAGKTVLLVEDNHINAVVATRLLEAKAMKIVLAENGEIAVHEFEKAPPGTFFAILMDMRMPVMDGLTATKKIRAMTDRADAKEIPIIAMTANAFEEDVDNCIRAGMNAHLSKPIEPQKLYESLAENCLKQ